MHHSQPIDTFSPDLLNIGQLYWLTNPCICLLLGRRAAENLDCLPVPRSDRICAALTINSLLYYPQLRDARRSWMIVSEMQNFSSSKMAKFANPFSKSEKGKKAQPTRQPTIPVAPDQYQLAISVEDEAIASLAPSGESESTTTLPEKSRLLWNEAAEKLNDEERKVLGLQLDQSLSLTAAIDEVAQQVEKACEKYQAGGWKIKRSDGSVRIDVRASAKSILKCALRSKGIVEAAVKFDPTGYCKSDQQLISSLLTGL